MDWKPLATNVIAVAIEGYAGDWAAYIGAVSGKHHEEEVEEVLNHGAKLSKEIAEILFPEFKRLKYRY
jgi:hypothetical protein